MVCPKAFVGLIRDVRRPRVGRIRAVGAACRGGGRAGAEGRRQICGGGCSGRQRL